MVHTQIQSIYPIAIRWCILRDKVYHLAIRWCILKDNVYPIAIRWCILRDKVYLIAIRWCVLTDKVYPIPWAVTFHMKHAQSRDSQLLYSLNEEFFSEPREAFTHK